jgi:hypothetical protein
MESNPNSVEVVDSGKFKYWAMIVVVFVVLIIVNIWLGFNIVIILADFLFLVIFIPIMCYCYKLYTSISKFIISDTGIQFVQWPKSHTLQVNWSDFESIKMKVTGTRAIPFDILDWHKPVIRTLIIKFLQGKPQRKFKSIKYKIFSDKKVKEILLLLKDYSSKLNKRIITTSRIKHYYDIDI